MPCPGRRPPLHQVEKRGGKGLSERDASCRRKGKALADKLWSLVQFSWTDTMRKTGGGRHENISRVGLGGEETPLGRPTGLALAVVQESSITTQRYNFPPCFQSAIGLRLLIKKSWDVVPVMNGGWCPFLPDGPFRYSHGDRLRLAATASFNKKKKMPRASAPITQG